MKFNKIYIIVKANLSASQHDMDGLVSKWFKSKIFQYCMYHTVNVDFSQEYWKMDPFWLNYRIRT